MERIESSKTLFEKQMLEATEDNANFVESLSAQVYKLSFESKAEQQNLLDKVHELNQHAKQQKQQNLWVTAL